MVRDRKKGREMNAFELAVIAHTANAAAENSVRAAEAHRAKMAGMRAEGKTPREVMAAGRAEAWGTWAPDGSWIPPRGFVRAGIDPFLGEPAGRTWARKIVGREGTAQDG